MVMLVLVALLLCLWMILRGSSFKAPTPIFKSKKPLLKSLLLALQNSSAPPLLGEGE